MKLLIRFVCKCACIRVILCILFISSQAYTETAPQHTFSLDQLIQKALSRSELIIARKELIEEIKSAKKQAGSWKNPSVSFGSGVKQAENKTGPLYNITISQPFIFPGKTGLIEDMYNADEKIAGLTLEETKLIIRYEVIRISYAYKIAEEIEGHLKERVERLKFIEEYLANRPFASPKKRMEKNIIQGRLSILQKNLAELKSEQGILWSRLNLYTDFPEKIKITAGWYKKGPVLKEDSLTAMAIGSNIEIQKQKTLLDKIKYEIRLAEKEFYPNFDLMAFYSQEKAAGMERSLGAGMAFSLPVINRNMDAVRSLNARSKAEKAQLDYQKRQIKQNLQALYAGYSVSVSNLTRFPISLLHTVHSQLYDADNEFRKGTIDLLTYLEAESQAYESHIAIFNSQREFIEKYISILMLAGSAEFTQGE